MNMKQRENNDMRGKYRNSERKQRGGSGKEMLIGSQCVFVYGVGESHLFKKSRVDIFKVVVRCVSLSLDTHLPLK